MKTKNDNNDRNFTRIIALAVLPVFYLVLLRDCSLVDFKVVWYGWLACFLMGLTAFWVTAMKKTPAILVNPIDLCVAGLFFIAVFGLHSHGLLPSVRILILFVFYLVFRFTQDLDLHWKQIFPAAFLGAGVLQTIIVLFQVWGFMPSLHPQFSTTGTFCNPDGLGGYLATMAPFALGLYFFSDNKFVKRVAVLFLALLVVVLPVIPVRNAWISTAAGLTYIIVLKYWKAISSFFQQKKRLACVSISGLLSLILMIWALYALRPDSIHGRLFIWKVASRMVFEKPLLGLGYDNFGERYGHYQAAYFARMDDNPRETFLAGHVNHAHNEYLEIIIESGVLGFALFMALVYLLKRTKITVESNPLASVAKGSLLALLIFMFASFPMHIFPTIINILNFIAIIASERSEVLSIRLNRLHLKLAAVLMIAVSVALAVFLAGTLHHFKLWRQAVEKSMEQEYTRADSIFTPLYPHLRKNGQFLLNYGGMLSLKGEHCRAIPILLESERYYADPNINISLANSYAALGDLKKAEKNYFYAHHMIPNRLYPLYLLTLLYVNNGEHEKARAMGKVVVNFREKVPSPAIQQMKIHIRELMSARLAVRN